MRYAIIAAGEGSRLACEGISEPKPLVRLGDDVLIDRLIRIFMQHDADEIVVICNDRTAQVASHLARLQRDGLQGRPVPLRFVVKSTPSSMHSLFEISEFLEGKPFILTTVDTIFSEDDFAKYVSEVEAARDDEGVMAVTGYVDDESPLYVETDNMMNIRGFHDEPNRQPFISAGIYGLPPKALDTLRRCVGRGEHRMRNFQRALVSDGFRLKAFPMGKVIDIDHATDIQKAGELIGLKALLVKRDAAFSPNAEVKDLAILRAVGDRLEKRGYAVEMVEEKDLSMFQVSHLAPRTSYVFSMARSERALDILKRATCRVVNAPEAVTLCNSRIAIDRLMRENDIPCAPEKSDNGYWVKSDRGHDVKFVKAEELSSFASDPSLLITAHVEGREVKFYGVRNSFFFPEEFESVRYEAERLAGLVGLDVYGGDCIVRPDGTFAIIDFNDWPSFSPCREEAADNISEFLLRQAY
ncbi:MAG: NTP transferase domain-containing protein [Prevotella sp.]|nr:NTP transferase domain-containing protein [Prevotella sp.]